MKLRVALLHDPAAVRPDAPADERGVAEALDAVGAALRQAGHEIRPVAAAGVAEHWLADLRALAPHVVFNLCEGSAASGADEVRITAAVELLGVPLTGSGAETLALARRKDRTNAVLAAAGVPVAEWRLVTGAAVPTWHAWPAIVKPAAEDASVGIGAGSVVASAGELSAALGAARRPALVQRFLPGREFNVGIVAGETLPVAEIDFTGWLEDGYPRVTYDAKWDTGSPADLATRPLCPAPLAAAEEARIVAIARDAWRAVEGRGYGRVDLRLDADGTPHVLEVNPNPDLAPQAGLARMATAHGWSYAELLERICRDARLTHRRGARPAAPAPQDGSRVGS